VHIVEYLILLVSLKSWVNQNYGHIIVNVKLKNSVVWIFSLKLRAGVWWHWKNDQNVELFDNVWRTMSTSVFVHWMSNLAVITLKEVWEWIFWRGMRRTHSEVFVNTNPYFLEILLAIIPVFWLGAQFIWNSQIQMTLQQIVRTWNMLMKGLELIFSNWPHVGWHPFLKVQIYEPKSCFIEIGW
jgi:hypothetical protein